MLLQQRLICSGGCRQRGTLDTYLSYSPEFPAAATNRWPALPAAAIALYRGVS